MRIATSAAVMLGVWVPSAASAQDLYGGASASAVYSSSGDLLEEEVIDSSALVGRVYSGARWNADGDTSRIQASSNYYNYLDRKDRWSNLLEAEQQLRISRSTRIGVEISAGSKISTLEARSADQLAARARLVLEPGDHRFTLNAGLRHRYYDGSAVRSWSPILEADYRYRFGRYRYFDLEVRREVVDSSSASLDYRRTSLGAFYTHPFGGDTRVRLGVASRHWNWESRLAPNGNRLRDRVFVPQARLATSLSNKLNLELDYRHFRRRSNDEGLERNGNRLAATLRVEF